MERSAQQIVDMYTYEGPENTVEDQIVSIENSILKRASIKAITIGIIGCLLLGIGMSLTMLATDFFVLGIIVGVVGIAIVCANYPLYRRSLQKMREAAKPQIMKLASQL
ncbi:hypothetical protein [Anaerotardibacter muris]|uniref:hypothetical protein n=1 Tax=Anaerotardibacter muris TaxID=2941505 RepID=UPI00203D6B8F|nr:hypothetical protein [Anaerotardibacter muris]